jgi:hypothetical protein
VTRAIAIATRQDYRGVYDALNEMGQQERPTKRGRKSSSRTGVSRKMYEKYLLARGWVWTPTMKIGSGCTVHLVVDELPAGRLIVSLSRHLTCVSIYESTNGDKRSPEYGVVTRYGVVRDTHDPTRGGTRCVYGYYVEAAR